MENILELNRLFWRNFMKTANEIVAELTPPIKKGIFSFLFRQATLDEFGIGEKDA